MTADPTKAAASEQATPSSAPAEQGATPQPEATTSAAKKTATKKTAKKMAAAKKPATKRAATKKAATTKTRAKGATVEKAPPKQRAPKARPARGAFAAGAARASGERRRRSGTPLIPTAPVDLSPARRLAAGSDDTADEVIVAAVTEGPTEPETSAAMTPRAIEATTEESTTGEATTGTTGREPGALDVADVAEPDEPSDALPAEPTPARTRPSRASMRSTRRATTGAPTRLRAVPSVDSDTPHDEARGADPGPRHTPSPAEGGWEHALTSGLQSRAEKLVGAVLEGAEFSSESRPGPTELVELAVNVLRAAATSAGVPAEEAERQVAEALAYLRRRLTGDYVVDEFGFDEDYTVSVHLPLLRPLYQKWFRVEVRGIENIPDVGGALVVGNHSGTIAMDSLMTQVAVYDEHPRHRHLRMLGADLVFQMPFIGTMARRSGTTLAANSDAERLLSNGALVGVWPEGFKGVGKPFSERYKLQRFGRGGFVSAALRAGVPIVPVSIVGAEEIYPILGNMPAVARLLGLPYAPITPTFPLLGPLGMVPLPSKWLIEFGPPIETTSFGPEAADDPMLVFDLTDQVRETIQQTLYSLLMQRKSVFL
ncbi:1-acyl-sn-glycerol-3-phosphate acyltransferase [Terrabacter sp. 2YAF2]|uniref:lysophospholipid acyltransferase family protein n=1 Tax=Terrabacter sp. 2YAF2 TaxID=3233026 RepID=UPI003F97B5FF